MMHNFGLPPAVIRMKARRELPEEVDRRQRFEQTVAEINKTLTEGKAELLATLHEHDSARFVEPTLN